MDNRTLHFSYLERIRSYLSDKEVFDKFVKYLFRFNEGDISRQELLSMAKPFFSKAPKLYGLLKEILGVGRHDGAGSSQSAHRSVAQEEIVEESETDFATCKRLGASYCAFPKNRVPSTSSGRSDLGKELLNDVWVSFPTWAESSSFGASRKNHYEEQIFRCDDERFELDITISANSDAIRTLECVTRRMGRMTDEELTTFQLDDRLGGTSTSITQRSVKRIYGDKAPEIIHWLKRCPYNAIPILLKRLKRKEKEWKESQKEFNEIWRDEVKRYYLKSLDHQGITFKQSDIRVLRAKTLIDEIQTIKEERLKECKPDQLTTPLTEGVTSSTSVALYSEDACIISNEHIGNKKNMLLY